MMAYTKLVTVMKKKLYIYDKEQNPLGVEVENLETIDRNLDFRIQTQFR